MHFDNFFMAEINYVKMPVFELLESSWLISHKMSVAEKSLSFYTVSWFYIIVMQNLLHTTISKKCMYLHNFHFFFLQITLQEGSSWMLTYLKCFFIWDKSHHYNTMKNWLKIGEMHFEVSILYSFFREGYFVFKKQRRSFLCVCYNT